MKRYFYPSSRAHHAACMAIDFGMQFTEWRWDANRFCFAPTTANDDEPNERLYIHPDSVALLEPQLGDWLVEFSHGTKYMYEFIIKKFSGRRVSEDGQIQTEWERTYFEKIGCSGGKYLIDKNHAIIQRNGKPFHWPEVEV